MGYDLVDIKRRLDIFRAKEHKIKNKIIKKIEDCYFAVFNFSSSNAKSIDYDVHKDLNYIGELLERYSADGDYLTKEHLIKLNNIYRKYK